MLLYAPQVSPRLQYIVDLISIELLYEPIRITSDIEKFKNYEQPRINYSPQRITDNEFFIKSTSLLYETDIREQAILCFEQKGYKAFFKTTQDDLGFDILAASFYLVSRYEEYLPYKKDNYGRYSHINSLAHKENFLHLPLINIWLQDLKSIWQQKFPDLYFHHRRFKFLATYDIDIAYSYLNKGWLRNVGGALRSLFQGRFGLIAERISVLMGKEQDPFDSYEWLDALHLYCRAKAYYFFLVADKQKGRDKNVHPSNKALQNLIRYHASGSTIGLHPSWQSGDDEELLEEEKDRLEDIAGKHITHSRQHFVRFTLPLTYRRLIKAGVEKDFSMGYGSTNGFRASIASSFNWYDLEKEISTDLIVYPFCYMDANSYYEHGLNPQQAFDEMMHYYYIIKKVKGLMITVWHNNFLGTDVNFEGWREVYEIFLKEEVYWDR